MDLKAADNYLVKNVEDSLAIGGHCARETEGKSVQSLA